MSGSTPTPLSRLLFPPPQPIRHHGNTYTHAHPTPSGHAHPLTDRQKYLQYLHSLLHLLLQRHPILPTTGTQDAGHQSSASPREVNATRVGRIVRILWGSREWREGELWREGLAWAGLDMGQGNAGEDDLEREQRQGSAEAEDHRQEPTSTEGQHKRRRLDSEIPDGSEGDESFVLNASLQLDPSRSASRPATPTSSRASSLSLLSDHSNENEEAIQEDEKTIQRGLAAATAASERRMDFLRRVAARRRGLRPLMLACRAQELIALGRWKEALDEIELVLQSPAYRSSPELNLYAGLLVILVSTSSQEGQAV